MSLNSTSLSPSPPHLFSKQRNRCIKKNKENDLIYLKKNYYTVKLNKITISTVILASIY